MKQGLRLWFHFWNASCLQSIRPQLKVLINPCWKWCSIKRVDKCGAVYFRRASLCCSKWKLFLIIVRWDGVLRSHCLIATVPEGVLHMTSCFNIRDVAIWFHGTGQSLENCFQEKLGIKTASHKLLKAYEPNIASCFSWRREAKDLSLISYFGSALKPGTGSGQ